MNIEPVEFDLSREDGVRALNAWLHQHAGDANLPPVRVLNPDGAHNIAVGADAPFQIDVSGHAGYYVAGMNKHAPAPRPMAGCWWSRAMPRCAVASR
jgi:hypothetical protein